MNAKLTAQVLLSMTTLVVLGCSGNPDAQVDSIVGEQTQSPTVPPDPALASASANPVTPLPPPPKTESAKDAGSTTPDAGEEKGDGGAGTAGFGATCAKNKDCQSNVCVELTGKGKRCTKACNSDLDCVGLIPSIGCGASQPGGPKVCRVL